MTLHIDVWTAAPDHVVLFVPIALSMVTIRTTTTLCTNLLLEDAAIVAMPMHGSHLEIVVFTMIRIAD